MLDNRFIGVILTISRRFHARLSTMPHRSRCAMKLCTREPWMVSRMPALLTGSGYILTLFAAAYALIALFCRPRTYRRSMHAGFSPPPVPQPVTVLKPLCGDEPRLEENLVTLCEQSYPEYQLLFGVRDPLDPAIAVVERLKRRFPKREIQL